jgi:hypothetical protein
VEETTLYGPWILDVFISIPSNIQGPYKVVSSTIEALNGLALNENGKASLALQHQ